MSDRTRQLRMHAYANNIISTSKDVWLKLSGFYGLPRSLWIPPWGFVSVFPAAVLICKQNAIFVFAQRLSILQAVDAILDPGPRNQSNRQNLLSTASFTT